MAFESFTPVTGSLGGSLIGLSAATLLLFNGDILGASGVMSSFVAAPEKTLESSQTWKLLFIVAFVVASRVYLVIDPAALDDAPAGASPGIPVVSRLGFVVGGLLVGFGTRLGNGCTTGHGICGMARLSVRSFVGVISFMFSGILFASVCPETNPHLRDTNDGHEGDAPTAATTLIVSSFVAVAFLLALIGLVRHRAPFGDDDDTRAELKDELANDRRKILPAMATAAIFAVGLIVSQMTLYSKIFGFLNLTLVPRGTWDPTLITVMVGGLLVSFLSYQCVEGFNLFNKNSNTLQCPLTQKSTVGRFNIPTNKVVDLKLVLGEATFGLGWGMAGLCPGPAMVRASAGHPNVLLRWWPMFFVGSLLAEKLKNMLARRSLNKHEVPPLGKVECSLGKDEDNQTTKSAQATIPCEDEEDDAGVECV
mmetsp:Transcript_37271/g.79462  ORF Transcript_37271/g.79462 Transcript_37271/m.79462 type:complete len:423 (-) Transcript_37271:64-1332(-)